jgi:BASS family bile acid:Na+ symporter
MNAADLFNAIFNAGLVTMLLTLIASLGMTFSVSQILEPVRRGWLLAGTIVVNTVLAPLVAIGVCQLLPLTSQARVGVAIVTIAAAGPACLKACELAKRADMAMAVSFTIVLQLINIIAAPLWAKVIVTGAEVNPWSIVVDLCFLVLLPLIVGLILRGRYPEHRDGWKAGLERVSDIALYIAIGFGLAANWKAVITILGSWVILASVVIIVVYIVLGWAVAFRNRQAAVTISMVSAMRFTPIGLVVISTVLHNQSAYLTPALMFALVDTIIPFAVAAELGRYLTRAEGKPAPAAAPPSATAKARSVTAAPPQST